MKDSLGYFLFGASLIAILSVAIRQNLFRDVEEMSEAVKIGLHNIGYQLAPDRRRPISVIDKELGLRQLHPEFFNKLSEESWQEFWDIIYGTHPLIDAKNFKLPDADRNYYIAEVEDVLVKRYPEAFSGFGEEHWRMFWKEIFGILDYKLQILDSDEWMRKQRNRADSKLEKKMREDDARISSTVESFEKELKK